MNFCSHFFVKYAQWLSQIFKMKYITKGCKQRKCRRNAVCWLRPAVAFLSLSWVSHSWYYFDVQIILRVTFPIRPRSLGCSLIWQWTLPARTILLVCPCAMSTLTPGREAATKIVPHSHQVCFRWFNQINYVTENISYNNSLFTLKNEFVK